MPAAVVVVQEVEFTTTDQEEMATFYAGMAPDGPHLGEAKKAEIFNKNFMRDFRSILGDGHVIKVRGVRGLCHSVSLCVTLCHSVSLCVTLYQTVLLFTHIVHCLLPR